MIEKIKKLIEEKGSKLEIVSIDKIGNIEKELLELQKTTQLNVFHKWVKNNLYNFKTSQSMKSVIIVAVPNKAYANIIFNKNGRKYKPYGLVKSPIDKTKRHITTAVKKMGYTINNENRLPFKRLAVQSGLAEYGRNNITYVNGMRSFLSYMAFSTDIACEKDIWRKVVVSKFCTCCNKCIKICPTKAIEKDNFIFDVGRCLSFYNENDFSEWLPKTAHHTPYDCLKCQVNCPMNAKYLKTIDVDFNETETDRILKGKPYNDVSKELKNKIDLLGLDIWGSIPCNLNMLFSMMDEGYKPSLRK
jgi:epoxyqueuosine reductase